MSEHPILLPQHAYETLVKVAKEQGMTPADWIVSQLPIGDGEEPSLQEKLTGLIGAIDSQKEPHHQFSKTAFGDGIAAKLAKQGLRRPRF